MTEEIKLGIKSVLEQRKEYDALNYINELEERLETVIQSLHEQCEIVSKQVEQIEKLKGCHNCKYSSCSGSIEPCKYCKFCWYSEKKKISGRLQINLINLYEIQFLMCNSKTPCNS